MIDEMIYEGLTQALDNRATVVNGYPNNLKTNELPLVAFRISSKATTLETLSRTNNIPDHIHYNISYRVDLFANDGSLVEDIEDVMLSVGFKTTMFTKLIDNENPLIKHYIWDFSVPAYRIKRS